MIKTLHRTCNFIFMKKWIGLILAVVVVGGGAYYFTFKYTSITTSPVYTETTVNASGIPQKIIELPSYHISLQIPKDWIVGSEHRPYAGDVAVVPISSPQDPTYSPSILDCPSAGCSRYAFSISATTKWPHDPK